MEDGAGAVRAALHLADEDDVVAFVVAAAVDALEHRRRAVRSTPAPAVPSQPGDAEHGRRPVRPAETLGQRALVGGEDVDRVVRAGAEGRHRAGRRAGLHSTSGGLSETELKRVGRQADRVPSAPRAVTMFTPVANMPSAARTRQTRRRRSAPGGGLTAASCLNSRERPRSVRRAMNGIIATPAICPAWTHRPPSASSCWAPSRGCGAMRARWSSMPAPPTIWCRPRWSGRSPTGTSSTSGATSWSGRCRSPTTPSWTTIAGATSASAGRRRTMIDALPAVGNDVGLRMTCWPRSPDPGRAAPAAAARHPRTAHLRRMRRSAAHPGGHGDVAHLARARSRDCWTATRRPPPGARPAPRDVSATTNTNRHERRPILRLPTRCLARRPARGRRARARRRLAARASRRRRARAPRNRRCEALRARLDAVLAEPVPARLSRRDVAAPPASRSPPSTAGSAGRRPWRPRLRLGGVIVGAGVMWRAGRPRHHGTAADRAGWCSARGGHSVYVPEVRHPVEVTAQEEPRALADQAAGHAGQAVRPARQGFELVGGRLLPDAKGPSAQLDVPGGSASRPRPAPVRVTVYLRKPEDGAAGSALRAAGRHRGCSTGSRAREPASRPAATPSSANCRERSLAAGAGRIERPQGSGPEGAPG